MATLSTRIAVDFRFTQDGPGTDNQEPYSDRIREVWELTSGTGADQADLMLSDAGDITGAGTSDIDLFGSIDWPLNLAMGPVEIAEMVAMAILNVDAAGGTNDVSITVGGDAAAWATWLGSANTTIGPITPGGMFFITNPDATGLGAVADTTADTIQIAGGSGTSSGVQKVFIGRSA